MLYIAECKQCDFVMWSKDSATIKEKIADHLLKHGIDIPFPSEIRLKSDDLITLMRVRSKNVVTILLQLFSTKRYWHGYRNRYKLASQIASLFSGQLNGESKSCIKHSSQTR